MAFSVPCIVLVIPGRSPLQIPIRDPELWRKIDEILRELVAETEVLRATNPGDYFFCVADPGAGLSVF